MLAVAMGIGRFAYTPLLPIMERDAGLTVGTAGGLASANLFGYLAGAMLAMWPYLHGRRVLAIRVSLAVIVVSTLLMVAPSPLWAVLRFVTGVGSGIVLIFASSLVLERAAQAQRPAWPPLFFAGVGAGIAFSGIAVPLFARVGGSTAAWAGLAVVSAIVLVPALRWFVPDPSAPVITAAPGGGTGYRGGTFGVLLVVYTAEAFAYVIPATFLVAIVDGIGPIARFAPLAWVVVGCAAAISAFPWIHAAAKFGKAKGLALALAIQGAGIVAPVFSRSALAVAVAALALGGTFMAITLFASGLGRDLFPHRTSAAMSRLTLVYSLGQIAGPLAATQIALRAGSYDGALLVAGAAAVVAAVLTVALVHEPRGRVALAAS